MITLINNGNLAVDIPRGGSSFPLFPFEFRMFVFYGGRKTGGPGEKLSERRQFKNQQQTQPTCLT